MKVEESNQWLGPEQINILAYGLMFLPKPEWRNFTVLYDRGCGRIGRRLASQRMVMLQHDGVSTDFRTKFHSIARLRGLFFHTLCDVLWRA